MTPPIEPRPNPERSEARTSGSYRTSDTIAAELTALAAQLDRVKSEERRLYAARLAKWVEARAAGLSWRAIAAASGGMDHAQIAKTVGRSVAKGEGLGVAKTVGKIEVRREDES